MNLINPIWFVVIAFMLALVPILVGMATSYVKISIVLGMLRSGLGAQQVPGNMVIMALSVAMTLYILSPVIHETYMLKNEESVQRFFKNPTLDRIGDLAPLTIPLRRFLEKHAGERELATLVLLNREREQKYSNNIDTVGNDIESNRTNKKVEFNRSAQDNLNDFDPKRVSWGILMPAFVVTELREAFAMGFAILLPFLVIDLVVSNILIALGMYMVSPIMISLPIKLILFVMCDGWIYLMRGLVNSYV